MVTRGYGYIVRWIDLEVYREVSFRAEVCGCLVVPAVFKTDVTE